MKNLKSVLLKRLFFLFLYLFSSHVFGSTYYISSVNGNDGSSLNEAQQINTPWKTLSKVNEMSSNFKPGDSILFKSGEVFFGVLRINNSGSAGNPIVFSSYGQGSMPEITGFTTLSGWQQKGNNIWETTVSGGLSYMNTLLVNGEAKAIGRYPNANAAEQGYLHYDSYNNNTSITDSKLATQPNWSGGQVVIRKTRWVLDRNQITSQSGNTINYNSQSGYYADQGYGYFIQNHPSTLDVDGEWYYQPNGNKLGIFFSGTSPDSYQIRAGVAETLVQLTNQGNLSFTNIRFSGATVSAFNISGSQNIHISGCEIMFSGQNAINATNTYGLVLENSTIGNTGNIACLIINCTNTVLNNNQIHRTGTYAGMGEGDSGSYEGLLMDGDNNLVENNTIDSTGYIPLTFSGNNVTIKNNVISNFALVKDDGGGIYTWNNGSNAPINYNRVVSGNIVLNGIGAAGGTRDLDKLYAHGIYIDDNAGQVEIANNTVANCASNGIYIHNAHDINIKQNTIYNNAVQLLMEHDNVAANSPIYNMSVTGNILFAKLASQLPAAYKTKDNDIANFGTFNNNYYYRPLDNDLVIGILQQVNGVYSYNTMSVDSWKALYGKDANSTKSTHNVKAYTVNNVSGGNQFSNGTFDSNIGGLYSYSSANNCSTTWNNGTLDGGALKVSFSSVTSSSNYGSVIIGIGSVTAGKTYRLKFSMLGSYVYKSITAYLRQSANSYADLSDRKALTITGTRIEKEWLFTATSSESNASVVFDVPEQSSPLYLDNIQLNAVDATITDPNDYIKFFFNPTTSIKAYNITALSYDAASNSYQNSVNVAPFSSAALVLSNSTDTTIGPVIPANPCTATGTILREQWNNVGGNNISDFSFSTTASSTSQIAAFEGPMNIADNYASRIRGYICPPQSGNYTFWIAADDAAELWLSTDDNPANKARIANVLSWTDYHDWYKYPSQKSVSITLQAGKKYYVEALHKEGGGSDNLSVQWLMPDGTMEAPIAGNHLSPFTGTTVVVPMLDQTIDFPAIANRFVGDAPFNIGATASSGLAVGFRIVSGPATISGNTITVTGQGQVVVEASQAGNATYNAAKAVDQAFTVSQVIATAACSAIGTILREQWDNIGGYNVSDFSFATTASSTSQIASFEGPMNIADNYASRIRGYICPPQSGNYTFWIAADDAADLWLSTDDNPANKARIANVLSYTNYHDWYKDPSQKSVSITLVAGKKYYVEALHKEGTGSDNLSVQWQMPDGTMEAPIAGTHLSPFTGTTVVVTMLDQTIDFPTVPNKNIGDAPFNIGATASSGLAVSFRIVSGPATISGNTITVTGQGQVVVEAYQAGNATYNGAKAVDQTFTVSQFIATAACSGTGTILREQWDNIGGYNVSDFSFATTASSTSQIASFEGPMNIADNYASRIRGYICPPQSGNYTFWIAADDAAELWLSTDDNPANKARIANVLSYTNYHDWYKDPSQKSVSITLQAGKKYYVEALHKEGGGSDNLSVQWQMPDGTMEAPIAGSHLSPFTGTTVVVPMLDQTIDFPAITNRFVGDAPFNIGATASSGLAVGFRIVSGPATISGNTITVTGQGQVVVEASQAGNATYNSAKVVDQAFTVSPVVATGICSATGTILREQWDNVGGNNLSDFSFATTASSIGQISSFEGPVNIADNYASRIRGYICPPQSGNYTFWIAADDAAELWLSTDDNPANKVRIANVLSWTDYHEWYKYPSQKSVSITLVAGKKYYVEALHKEGGGGDNLSVQWQMPDGTIEAPIAGSHLSPYILQNSSSSSVASSVKSSTAISTNTDVLVETVVEPGLLVYPNPASHQASIGVTLSESSQTSIKLYNSAGILVKNIYNGNVGKSAKMSIGLNCELLPNGIYFINLLSGKVKLTKKLVVINK